MAKKESVGNESFGAVSWEDAWESDIALVEPEGPAALREGFPRRDGAWSGDRFQVPADLACGTWVRRQIQNVATEHCMAPDDTADLVLAVSEAFNNAVRHGTSRQEDAVEFRLQLDGGTAIVELRYLGEAFSVGVPELPAVSSSSGRGRYIMAMLLDDVRYDFAPPWTVVRLVKRYRTLSTPQLSGGK